MVDPGVSMEYFVFLLSVLFTTLIILFVGSLARSLKRRTRPSFKKKLLFFPLLLVGIAVLGGVTEQAQVYVFEFLREFGAMTIPGLIVFVVVAWFLYDWVVWRRH